MKPRAVLMFDGPPAGARYCEGCPLFEVARDEQDGGPTCPIWGTLYLKESGPSQGLLCRADACIDNEVALADPAKRDSIWHALSSEA
jgi:hypothetical protein